MQLSLRVSLRSTTTRLFPCITHGVAQGGHDLPRYKWPWQWANCYEYVAILVVTKLESKVKLLCCWLLRNVKNDIPQFLSLLEVLTPSSILIFPGQSLKKSIETVETFNHRIFQKKKKKKRTSTTTTTTTTTPLLDEASASINLFALDTALENSAVILSAAEAPPPSLSLVARGNGDIWPLVIAGIWTHFLDVWEKLVWYVGTRGNGIWHMTFCSYDSSQVLFCAWLLAQKKIQANKADCFGTSQNLKFGMIESSEKKHTKKNDFNATWRVSIYLQLQHPSVPKAQETLPGIHWIHCLPRRTFWFFGIYSNSNPTKTQVIHKPPTENLEKNKKQRRDSVMSVVKITHLRHCAALRPTATH